MKQRLIRVWIGTLLSLASISWGGPIEAWHLMLAQHYTQQKQYSKALKAYEGIAVQSDSIHYNLGNILYHQQHYAEAISQYMQIQSPALMHQRYHNIGNCLMKMGEIASAVRFYRNALKFVRHPDTLFNLSLARKRLKKEAEEAEAEARKAANETLEFREGNNSIDRYKEDNGTTNLKDAKSPKEIVKKINSATAVQAGEGGKLEKLLSQDNNHSTQTKQQQIDSYEAQRWKYFFKKRSLKTLLIPLETKGESHDKNPY